MPNKKSRIGPLRRRTVWATGVVTALAVAAPAAAPVAEASAQPLPALPLPALPLPAAGGLPAFKPAPLSFVGPSIGGIGVAIGPTVIGDVFNGGTTVVVSAGPGLGNTIGSP
jgi:hypothetical protein